MTDKALRAEDYVGHMLEAVTNVLAYTKGFDEARLRQTPVVRDALIRYLPNPQPTLPRLHGH